MSNRLKQSTWTVKSFYRLSIALVSVFLFIHCYQAPVTGRSQLILLPTQQVDQMGVTAFQEVVKKEGVSNNPRYNEALRRVASRITRVSDTPNYNWEYRVIDDDDTINAFALPGGKIGVYTGILPIAKNDAGLATVLAHEVGHVAAHHGAERLSAGILAELGAAGLGVALSNKDPGVVNAVMQAFGLGVTVGGILPFSRNQESEADRIGLIYMARAGYDPRESIGFWQRMADATKNKPRPPQFLSTHPGSGTRITNLQKWMPEAMYYYERSNKATNSLISLEEKEYKEARNAFH
jgi:predicted Zn-dependent protease